MKLQEAKCLAKSVMGIVALVFLASCAKDKNVNTDGLDDEQKNGSISGKLLKKELTGCTPNAASSSCIGATEYLLVRVIEDANGNNPFGATPGFSDNYGSVKIRISEDRLDFLPSNDLQFAKYGYYGLRWNGYKIVEKNEPIASFPILKHFDIGFKKNDYGEATNKKVELEEGPMLARAYMRVDWRNPIKLGFGLPNALSGRYAQLESIPRLTDTVKTHEDGSLSFDLANTIMPNFGWNFDSFTINTKTTLMKVKDTGFEPKEYSDAQFDRFGIFRNFQYHIGMQGPLKDKDIKKFAQVYDVCAAGTGKACSTNTIEMHLSAKMPEKYKELSIKAIEAWNKLFQESLGRTDDVVTYNAKEVAIADARHNMIAYVDTNFKNGALLGVSQAVVSPLTGETLTSRSTVFGDGIESSKAAVDRIIDSLIANPMALRDFLFDGKTELERAQDAMLRAAHSKHASQGLDAETWGSFNVADLGPEHSLSQALQSAGQNTNYLSNVKKMVIDHDSKLKERVANLDPKEIGTNNYTRDIHSLAGAESMMTKGEKAAVASNLLGLQDMLLAGQTKALDSEGRKFFAKDLDTNLSVFEKRQVNMAMHGIHGAELVEESVINFVKAGVIKSLKNGLGNGLTDEETLKELQAKIEAGDYQALITILKADYSSKDSPLRESLKEEVGKLVFYSTLLHELGHSFGLRHNFIASADEKNFHPKYHELKSSIEACKNKAAGCDPSVSKFDLEAYAFSSVMDYNGGFHNDLQALGPYDQAAIQYAYNPAKEIPTSFQFCTDDHVADNMLCNRFDRGVNLSEITLNRIKSYESRYFSSFFRRGRTFFGNPVGSLASRFMLPIRTVMDEGIYQLINAKPATSVLQQATGCSSMPDAISNYNDGKNQPEFVVNTCNNAQLEAFLDFNKIPKKPTDLDAVEYAINFRKPINEFKPLSRGDMVLSNVLAKRFFKSLLGSGEPGVYLPEEKDGKKILSKIPGVGPLSTSGGNTNAWIGQIQQGLSKMAEERNQVAADFVNANIRGVTNIDIGTGKYFKSVVKSKAGSREVQNVGSIYEKYYAMMVLGTRSLGVPKYYEQSLTGNAYLWPHTRAFAVETFSKMIQNDPFVSDVQYATIMGEPGIATIKSTQDNNTQNLASLFSVVFFISEQDKSFFRKLRVSHNVAECDREASKIQGKKVVVEIQGQVICAYDDINGESIVVPMLEKVKAASADVSKYQKIISNMPSLIADAKTKAEEISVTTMPKVKEQLQAGAEGFDDLKKSVIEVTGDEAKELIGSMPDSSLFAVIDMNKEIQQVKMQKVIAPLAMIVNTRVPGGVPAFQERVNDLVSGKIPRNQNPDVEEPVKKAKASASTKTPGISLPKVDSKVILEAMGFAEVNTKMMQVMKEKGPAQAVQNPITDDQLTQIARFYLDLMDFMSVISGYTNEVVQVKASDIFLDRATSSLDSQKAPVEELIKMVRMYGR